jgi:hypothetical protein
VPRRLALGAVAAVLAAGALTQSAPAAQPLHPSRLDITVGGFLGTTYRVLWTGRSLRYETHEGSKTTRTYVRPTAARWRAFWTSMAAVKLFSWEKSYVNPRVMDGTQWSVKVTRGTSTVRSTGSNAYPLDGSGPEQTKEFARFLRAVSKLAGKPFA